MKIDYRFYPAEARNLFLLIVMVFYSIGLVSQVEEKQFENDAPSDKMKATIARFEREYQKNQQLIRQKGAKSSYGLVEKKADGTVVALNGFTLDGNPIYYTTLTDPTSKVYRTNALYKGGALDLDLDGSGLNIGVWDAGVALCTHQEFEGRAADADGTESVSSHATLVTGAMISTGIKEKARGVAYAANALTHDWTRDKIEVAEAASNGLLVSNHSYGIKSDRVPDWYFGAYLNTSRDWDEIMYHAPHYLMVTAAGNARNNGDNEAPNVGRPEEGHDLLLGFATSKNGLTVAGANSRIGANGQVKQIVVAPYSSYGPTDDGRIKPDLAGDGTGVYSTTSATNSSYASASGTSMATPGVTASLLLLQEYHEQVFGHYMRSATLKGLALHTADDVLAKGPDYQMGWGLLNAQRAAEVLQRTEYSTLIAEETLNDSQTYSITVLARKGEPLVASLSWTDPVGTYVNRGNLNEPNPALTHDLDIRITKNGEIHYPWKLDPSKVDQVATKGDNLVDPYERVEIENAVGEYTITVSHKGKLLEGHQNFSLVVSGAQLSDCDLQIPQNLQLETAEEAVVQFSWNALNEALYEVQYSEKGTNDWKTLHTWDNGIDLTELTKGATYGVRVRSVCTENLASDFSTSLDFVFDGSETTILEPAIPNDALQLSVYPNPAIDEITIHGDMAGKNYSIANASGNLIKKGPILGAVNVSDLASGFYVLTVQDLGTLRSAKFYKQ